MNPEHTAPPADRNSTVEDVVHIQREGNMKRTRRMQKYELQLPVERAQLLGAANALGLEEEAIATLLRFGEVHISIAIDTKTGEVSNIKLV